MAFCEYSSEVVAKNSVTIDNLFITEFMPNANENYVKVYLYGLYKCSTGKDNSIEEFAKVLNLPSEDIISVFYYWEEVGLVQVLKVDPVQVRYLPVKNAIAKIKKYNVDKYTAFNISAQEIIGSKMLTPREFEEFYYLIENLHQEKEAVLKIIDYCVKLKGKNVSVNYIVAVAKNWAYDGIKTSEDVDNRLIEQERISGEIVLLLKAMGIKREASIDEYQMYLSWTKDLEMTTSLLVHIAKSSKSKNFASLENKVKKCYSLKLESEKEVDDYFASQQELFELAKRVVKNLGLWYNDLSVVVDTYILNWLQMGFDSDAILSVSNYAFRSSIRTLEALNNYIGNMFKLGLLTVESIDNYIQGVVRNDSNIKQILENLGINREVNSTDRLWYKTWLFDWNLTEDIIEYASALSKDKYMPMQYLNKILSEYHNAGVKTVDDAKSVVLSSNSGGNKKSKTEAKKREYSKKELDSLFDNIYEVEI